MLLLEFSGNVPSHQILALFTPAETAQIIPFASLGEFTLKANLASSDLERFSQLQTSLKNLNLEVNGYRFQNSPVHPYVPVPSRNPAPKPVAVRLGRLILELRWAKG
jgi:hypothetical protein